MLLKTQVIVNPESNQGKTRKRWKDIKEALKSFIKEFRYEFTEKPLHAVEIARDAIKSGSELIIGVGGDGTVNEIANGFFEGKKLLNPQVILGIVPSGTGCDFTRSLNIPKGLKAALEVITKGPPARVDIGKISFFNDSGKVQERFFLNVADFGIGGEVVREVNRRRMERKASSYIRCLISTMAHYKNKWLRLKVDGDCLPEDKYLVGAVANGRIFGKGMKIAPRAKLDDGLFDIVLVKSMRFLEFCRQGWKIFFGTHLSYHKVFHLRGKKIEAFPAREEDVLVEIDGEQVAKLPATFEIIPKNLLVKGYL